jgi:hypothetical protein
MRAKNLLQINYALHVGDSRFSSGLRPVGVFPLSAARCEANVPRCVHLAAVILAFPLSCFAATWIYSGAAELPEKQRLAAYLAIMAGGAAFLALVSRAGLIRNLFLFPLSRRAGPSEDHRIV